MVTMILLPAYGGLDTCVIGGAEPCIYDWMDANVNVI